MSKVFNMVGGGGGGGGGPAASIFVTGLSETDTVTATNGSKTLTGKWTQKPNPAAHGLPDGYTELEYIEGTGTQYIATNITVKPNLRMVVDAQFTSINSGANVISSGGVYLTSLFHLYFVNSGTTPCLSVYSPTNASSTLFTNFTSGVCLSRFSVDYDFNTLKAVATNGSITQTVTLSSNLPYDSNRPIQIFAENGASLSNLKLYGYKLYEVDSISLNLIPCKRLSDGAVGLYDLVSNAFFGNNGTGEFIAGPEVPQTIGGFLISKIKDYGTWTVTATDGTKTATQDVLVDVITEYEIEMSLSA